MTLRNVPTAAVSLDLDYPHGMKPEVSCQVLGQIFIHCDAKNIDVEAILRDTPFSRSHIENPANFDAEVVEQLQQELVIAKPFTRSIVLEAMTESLQN